MRVHSVCCWAEIVAFTIGTAKYWNNMWGKNPSFGRSEIPHRTNFCSPDRREFVEKLWTCSRSQWLAPCEGIDPVTKSFANGTLSPSPPTPPQRRGIKKHVFLSQSMGTFYTRQPLHQVPFTILTPDNFYNKQFLHQAPFTPESFFTDTGHLFVVNTSISGVGLRNLGWRVARAPD